MLGINIFCFKLYRPTTTGMEFYLRNIKQLDHFLKSFSIMIYGMKANTTIWPACALPFQVSLDLGRDLCVYVFFTLNS